MSQQPLYSIRKGVFRYGKVPIFTNLNCTLAAGHFYGLIGPNGSGKSTLIDLLMGILPLDSGTMTFCGKPIQEFRKKQLARHLALVPQTFSMGFDFSVFEIVLMGRHPHMSRFSNPSSEDMQIVNTALKTLDITHLRDRLVTRLSGGERQRVMVARAMAQQTGVLLLDEATANLDIKHTLGIMRTLEEKIHTSQATVIAAIHDLNLAAAFCDRLIVIKEGTIVTVGETRTILTENLIKEVFSVNSKVVATEDQIRVEFAMRNHA